MGTGAFNWEHNDTASSRRYINTLDAIRHSFIHLNSPCHKRIRKLTKNKAYLSESLEQQIFAVALLFSSRLVALSRLLDFLIKFNPALSSSLINEGSSSEEHSLPV